MQLICHSVGLLGNEALAHSAEYQSEVYTKQLEFVAQTMLAQASELEKVGQDSLAKAASEQAANLHAVIAKLRSLKGR